jgi:hypothetical protein
MTKKINIIPENSFEGAPAGGTGGTVNYQTPYGTPNYASQDPSKFHSSNANKVMGKNSNTAKDVPDPEEMEKDINTIYKKKKVPTADQVIAGLQFELHNMIKPDKRKAKELVIKNLKEDPDWYGKLHHMNIDDKHMKVDVQETKKIFTELAAQKQKKYVVNQGIVDVIRDLQEQRKNSREFLKD